MRKGIAISLIALFAFNLGGYRILYFTIAQQHELNIAIDIVFSSDNAKAALNNVATKFTEKESSAKVDSKSVLSDFTEQPLLFEFSIDDHYAVPSGLFSQSRLLSPFCTVTGQPPELIEQL